MLKSHKMEAATDARNKEMSVLQTKKFKWHVDMNSEVEHPHSVPNYCDRGKQSQLLVILRTRVLQYYPILETYNQ